MEFEQSLKNVVIWYNSAVAASGDSLVVIKDLIMERFHLVVPMLLGLPVPMLAMSNAAPARTRAKTIAHTVTDAQNGSALTLKAGETLIVRLNSNPSTGASWAFVDMSQMPIRLVSRRYLAAKPANSSDAPIMGGGGIEEWKFVVSGRASYARSSYLKLLYLRSFEKGIKNARLWEIKVTVPAS